MTDAMITAVGSIPTDELTADNLGGDNAPLGRVIHRRVLAYRNDANRLHQFTWADFIKNYANKWGGAHLDEEIPAILATADAHSTGRTALASHLLRTMAVAARNAAQEIFCKIMRSDLTEPERDGWYSLAAIAPDGRPPLYYDNGALITLTISAESAYIGFDISDPRVVTPIGRCRLGGVYRNIYFLPDGHMVPSTALQRPSPASITAPTPTRGRDTATLRRAIQVLGRARLGGLLREFVQVA